MTDRRESDGLFPGRALPGPPERGDEPEPADSELLRRHVSGDHDAFGLLFLRHRDRLWSVALRTLGDPEDAADALQEAMISAFRRAGTFRGDCAVTTWLHRIVVNACIDRLRRSAARAPTRGMDPATLDALAPGRSHPEPGGDSDVSLDVMAALRTLPYEQRAALVLVDLLGYPVADAAEVLDVSAGTVKSRCARGRARLLPHLAHLRCSPETADQASRARHGTVAPPGRSPRAAGNRAVPGDVSPTGGGGEVRS